MRHPGEVTVRRRAGVDADDWGSAGVGGTIPQIAAGFLSVQPMIVIAGRAGDGRIWSTVLAGRPGFITVEDEATVTIGDELAMVDPLGGAFSTPQEIGMLAIDPGTRRRMRINGHASTTAAGLRVQADQVYSNCPKYIQTRTVTHEHGTAEPRRSSGTALSPSQQAWIARADTFFVGTGAPGLGLDLSHRGGNPGFIEVRPDKVSWPDYVGNAMYMTLGNLALDPRAGLLLVDWEAGHTLHLTGRAQVDWDPARVAERPGALRLIEFAIDEVVQLDHRLPLRWQLHKLSKFNPPVKGA